MYLSKKLRKEMANDKIKNDLMFSHNVDYHNVELLDVEFEILELIWNLYDYDYHDYYYFLNKLHFVTIDDIFLYFNIPFEYYNVININEWLERFLHEYHMIRGFVPLFMGIYIIILKE